MWLDLLALVLLAVFVLLGISKGALASGLSLVTMAASYAASLLLGPRLATQAAVRFDVPWFLGAAIATGAVFVAVYVVLGIGAFVVRAVAKERRVRRFRTRSDRMVGGVLGGARGVVVVLLVGWLALWMDALRVAGAAPRMPAVSKSALASVTSNVVEAGFSVALSDAGGSGRMAARVLARPAVAVRQIQAVLDHPRVATLRGDRAFWIYVENGMVNTAMNRSSFLRVSYDAELRRRLADLGLVDRRAIDDPRRFRREVADVLYALGPRLRGMRRDPEVRKLASDPEVARLVESGDTLALMRHPGFQRLLTHVTSNSPEPR